MAPAQSARLEGPKQAESASRTIGNKWAVGATGFGCFLPLISVRHQFPGVASCQWRTRAAVVRTPRRFRSSSGAPNANSVPDTRLAHGSQLQIDSLSGSGEAGLLHHCQEQSHGGEIEAQAVPAAVPKSGIGPIVNMAHLRLAFWRGPLSPSIWRWFGGWRDERVGWWWFVCQPARTHRGRGAIGSSECLKHRSLVSGRRCQRMGLS
jgi:hypothetical protein